MADAITIKALQDASLDAKSLEEVVNGNESKQVTTRKGETYPSVKKAIKTLFENGGIADRFKTLADLQASGLVDGSYALVADDVDNNNNGVYIKESGEWSKSRFDFPSIASAEVGRYIKQTTSSDLVNLVDANGVTYLKIDKDGNIYPSRMSESIQDNISRNYTDNGSDILKILDSEGNTALILTKTGELIVNSITAFDNSVNNTGNDTNTKQESTSSSDDNIFYFLDSNSSMGTVPLKKEFEWVNTHTEISEYETPFGPCFAQISENTFCLSYDFRTGYGDYIPISIVGHIVTYDPQSKTFNLGERKILANYGTLPDGTQFSYLNPNITVVESGANKGRILIHFNYMTNPVNAAERVFSPFYVYSDDNGSTFSSPIDMSSMFPMDQFSGRLNFGPGHGIQLRFGEHRGRLLFPAYQAKSDGSLYASIMVYSDDGGDTFNYGEALPIGGLNECQVAETTDGRVYGVFRMISNVADKYTAYSIDGGVTFGDIAISKDIMGAGTKVGLDQVFSGYNNSNPKIIAALARSPDVIGGQSGRIDPHIFVSYDNGKTYPIMKKLASGACQYTEVCGVGDGEYLVLYTSGRKLLAVLINDSFILSGE